MSSLPKKNSSRRFSLSRLFGYPTLFGLVLYVTLFLYGNSNHLKFTVQDTINSTIKGHFDLGALTLDSTLLNLTTQGLVLHHQDGRKLIEVDALNARFDPLTTLFGPITFSLVELLRPRILVSVDEEGTTQLEEAFESPEGYEESTEEILFLFDVVKLLESGILVHFPEGFVRLDNVYVEAKQLLTSSEWITFLASIESTHGHALFLPETFFQLTAEQEAELSTYRRWRENDPWSAAFNPPPPSETESASALQLPIDSLKMERVIFDGPAFRVDSLTLLEDSISASGFGGMTFGIEGDELFLFDFNGDLTLESDSQVLRYFLADNFTPTSDQTPPITVHFDRVSGTWLDIAGKIQLQFEEMTLLDWPVESLSLSLSTELEAPFVLVDEGLIMNTQGGVLQATGTVDTIHSVFDLGLWSSQIPLDWFLGPDIQDNLSFPVIGTVLTSPPAASAGEGFGLHLSGTYIDPEDTGDEEVDHDDTLLLTTFRSLNWLVGESEAYPFETVTASGALQITRSGVLRFTGVDGALGLSMQLDNDNVMIRGAVDLLNDRFEGFRVDGDISSLGLLFDDEGFDASATASVILTGPLSSPSLEVRSLDLGRFVADALRIQQLETSLEIQTLSENPDIEQGQLSLRDLSLRGFGPTVDSLQMNYTMTEGVISMTRGELDSSMGHISFDGETQISDAGQFMADPVLNFRLRGEELDLSALLPDQAGTVQSELTLSGTLEHPRLQGEITLKDAFLFDEWIDQGSADLRITENTISFSDLQIISELSEIFGELSLSSEGIPQSGELTVNNLALEQLRFLDNLGLPTTGNANAWIHLTEADEVERDVAISAIYPAIGQPDLEGNLVVNDLTLWGLDYGGLALTLDTYGDTVTALGQLAANLDTRIDIPLTPNRPLGASVWFERLPFTGMLPDLDLYFSAGEVVGGEINTTFFMNDPFEVKANLNFDRFWFESGGARFNSNGPVILSYSAQAQQDDGETLQQLSLSDFQLGTGDRFVTLTGEITNWQNLMLLLYGEADLALVSLFSDSIAEAQGTAQVDLVIGGRLDRPEPTGTIQFDPSSITVRGLGEEIEIRSGQLNIGATEEGLLNAEIRPENPVLGDAFGGNFSIIGGAEMDLLEIQSGRLELNASNVSMRLPEAATFTINYADLNLMLSDPSLPPVLRGTILLEEALYFEEMAQGLGDTVTGLFGGIFDREVERYVTPFWEENPLLGATEIDVDILASNGILVQSEFFGVGLDLELQVNLTMTGTPQDPLLSGDIKILEGEASFQNRRFNISDCTLLFQEREGGTGDLVPYIDNCVAEATIERAFQSQQRLTATGETSGLASENLTDRPEPYIIQATVDGYLDEISIELESVNVALQDADEWSLILTGSTLDEFSSAAAGEPSIEILFRQLMEFLESKVENTFDLDELVVTPTLSGSTTVYLADQINPRLNLLVETTVFGSEEDGQSVTLQYTVFDWLLLELSEQSQNQEQVTGDGRVRLRFDLN